MLEILCDPFMRGMVGLGDDPEVVASSQFDRDGNSVQANGVTVQLLSDGSYREDTSTVVSGQPFCPT